MKNYKIYLKEYLSCTGDYICALFYVVNNDNNITPIKISIADTFLCVWDKKDDIDKKKALLELGLLKSELMYKTNNVRDYNFLPANYPFSFQKGEEGYQSLKKHLENRIENIK